MSEECLRDNIRQCMGCGMATTGSIGASGYLWRSVCPSCKRAADDEALERIVRANRAIRQAEDLELFGRVAP